MSSEELKPCPFCGGRAERVTLQDEENFGGDVIVCTTCDACSRVVFGEKEGLNDAWNTRSQLAAIQGGMGEAVGFDRNAAYAACPESGCDWGSFYVGWKAAAAQHQRITAAMAAEVEVLHERNDALARDLALCAVERERFRAELAEVKGREAACFVVGKLEKTAVIAPPLPVGTKLYALPPASPDVEGLVKALEEVRSVIDAREMPSELALAALSNMIDTALSTWRQAQEGKP